MASSNTPNAIIKVNGQTLADDFNTRLISVTIEDKCGISSDTISINLRDGNPFISIPQKGDMIQAWLGFKETGTAYFGSYIIDDIEVNIKPDTLSINGKGADMRDSLKAQKSRHFDKKTIKEIITQIAQDHNLLPIIDQQIGAYQYKWIGQQDESDIHFVERLAKRHGALFSIKDEKLIFAKKGSNKSASGKDLPVIIASPANTIEGNTRVMFSNRSKFKNVKASYQDKETAERDVFSEDSDEDGTADYEIAEPFGSADEAKAAAKAKGEDLKAQTITTSCDVVGDPMVRAGCPFTYANMRPQIDGIIFNISSATHSLSNTGYVTSIDADLNPQKEDEAKKKNKEANSDTPMQDLDWSDLNKIP